jgi:hypothetical protein
MTAEYTTFINRCTSQELKIQAVYYKYGIEEYDAYSLKAFDGCYVLEIDVANIPDNNAEYTDFVSHYLSLSNKKIIPFETVTGWLKVRSRKLSGDLQMNFIYFTTGILSSFDDGGVTEYSMLINEAKTLTCIDFSPAYDCELGGGGIRVISDLSGKNLKVNFIAAPDIPSQYGGSFKFVGNKRFDSYRMEYQLDTDPKLIKYNAAIPTANKMRLEVTHGATDLIAIEYYLLASIAT